jgi:hypothetical protein
MVKIHVDIQALQFRKEADRSMDTPIFKTVVFDRNGKYVAGKESSLDLRLAAARFERLRQSGITRRPAFGSRRALTGFARSCGIRRPTSWPR